VRAFIVTIARIAAWLLTITIIILSLVPPTLRPVTDVPHVFEHFSIFFAMGVAFGVGYCRRPILVTTMLMIFAGGIELTQIGVPGRHARLSDFIVDALAACVGAAMASVVSARAILM
jgi:VanZ family protein